MRRHFPIGTVILFLAFLSIVVLVIVIVPSRETKVPAELNGVLRSSATSLRPFVLRDQHGNNFTLSNLEGKWTFLFFGYTFCPDICPTTLSLMSSLTSQLRTGVETSQGLQVVFVTVDPLRDTPETLATYLSFFRNDFVGVTGEQDKIRALAAQFDAMFFKQEHLNSEDYLMSHASSIFLVNPDTEFVATFSPPHHEKTISSQFKAIQHQY